ncbi:MAG TPA: NAD(P)/FAD-dependent oxidoreductase [Bacteroidales bacterium]
MQQQVSLKLNAQKADDSFNCLCLVVAEQLQINKERIKHIKIEKKSLDARRRPILVNYTLLVFIDEQPPKEDIQPKIYKKVDHAKPIIIVGTGPAGLFAALKLIEHGFRPLIFERGKEVSERKKDIALISRNEEVNAESNYCFGEGGAGTFSDGKLYTRSSKRGNIKDVLDVFVRHGAPESIMYEAHPHLGTDKLPEIIKNIRQTIIAAGGEFYFERKITQLLIEDEEIKGVQLHNGDKVEAQAVVLATGHSARDVYQMLHEQHIALEAKPFAVGVRVEHPQELIDNIQYHGLKRGENLPAASYSLVCQANGRGVFSFCMCPGGFIVPSATTNTQVVVNGMSPSKRNSPYANSGIVTEVRLEDLKEFAQYGPLAGLYFQEQIENMAWQNGGRQQTAPAQRLTDFIKGKISGSLPQISYFPGCVSSPVHMWLPGFVGSSLKEGFKRFDNLMHGFVTAEAVVLGVESRTSSSVRIPRNQENMQHVQIKGLFPCGEGAGYAGGITSSAIDGQNVANAVVNFLKQA